jgi:hypothetical protein
MRMKELMQKHVTENRDTMFRMATDVVRIQLLSLCRQVAGDLSAQVNDLKAQLARDYLAVLVGADAASKGPSRAELMLRAEMAPLLAKADQVFAELIPDQALPNHGGSAARREVEDIRSNGPLKSESDATIQDSIMVKTEPEE